MGIKASLELWKEDGLFSCFVIWLICGLCVILRRSMNHLVGVEWLDVDLIPIFVIYLIAKDRDFMASCLAFFMGVLTDIFSPCQLGLFAFLYSAISLGINHCRQFLDFNDIKTSILFVAIFLLAKWSFLVIVVRPSPLGHFTPLVFSVLVLISVLVTGMITPLLFCLVNLVRGKEPRAYP